MAVGLSGSNGGILNGRRVSERDIVNRPLEVSYFVNNLCNLKCKHCYVGYEESKGELSISEWINVFDELIDRGALTFGNVGKEPLLSHEKTISLLKYFEQRRQKNSRLRFGLVTNGTLLETSLAKEIEESSPDYIDVSLDGTEKEHDFIRGKTNYARTVDNLRRLPSDLAKKVFISYTIMRHNKDSFREMIKEMSNLGLTKFLVSPYIPTPSSNGMLALTEKEIANFYYRIVQGQEIDFSKLKCVEVLLKLDYDSQKPLMDKLVGRGVIDVNRLLIDDYGVLFNKYPQQNDSVVAINYMPFSDTLSRAVRISHDGYVGGCLEMFHQDYQKRARGNVRTEKIEDLLNLARV